VITVDKEGLRGGAIVAGGGPFEQPSRNLDAPGRQRAAQQFDHLRPRAGALFGDRRSDGIGQRTAIDDGTLVGWTGQSHARDLGAPSRKSNARSHGEIRVQALAAALAASHSLV
jgi:hypothetical protein